MTRRQFVSRSLVMAASVGLAESLFVSSLVASEDKDTIEVVQFEDSGRKIGLQRIPKVRKTDAEWKQQLSALQFDVTRKAGTERPFTGEYAESYEKGLYRCICSFERFRRDHAGHGGDRRRAQQPHLLHRFHFLQVGERTTRSLAITSPRLNRAGPSSSSASPGWMCGGNRDLSPSKGNDLKKGLSTCR